MYALITPVSAQELFHFCRLYAALHLASKDDIVCLEATAAIDVYKSYIKQNFAQAQWRKIREILRCKTVQDNLLKYPDSFKKLKLEHVKQAARLLRNLFLASDVLSPDEKLSFYPAFLELSRNAEAWFKIWKTHMKIPAADWTITAFAEMDLPLIYPSETAAAEETKAPPSYVSQCCVWLTQCFRTSTEPPTEASTLMRIPLKR